MYEMIRMIVFFAYGIGFLSCIPYGIWVLVTLIKKRWSRVFKQVAVPLVLWGLFAIADMVALNGLRDQQYREMFDADVDLTEDLYVYQSDRAFNGDGYSFYVYSLPDSVRTRFENADNRLLTQFPHKPGYRHKWDVVYWCSGPFNPEHDRYLNFALSSYDYNPELEKHHEAIRDTLQKESTYYAFFKYDHSGERVGDMDMFIVDLKAGKLYIINHNT